jgi:hypothetical protein
MAPVLAASHPHLDLASWSALEWVAVAVAAVAVVWSIWRSVRLTLRPGETEPDHIKRSVLVEPVTLEARVLGERALGMRLSSGSGGAGPSLPHSGAPRP